MSFFCLCMFVSYIVGVSLKPNSGARGPKPRAQRAHILAGKVACVDLPGGDSVGVLADWVVVVSGGGDTLTSELRIGVNALGFEGGAVVALLLGDDVLGALKGLHVVGEEASLLADGLVASDHLKVLLKHFRLTLVRGGPRAKFNCSFCKISQD